MEEQIMWEVEDNDMVYYMVKIRGSNLMKKISREDLLKKNKKLVEEYENRKNNQKLFIN